MLSLSKLPEREVDSPRKLSRWLDTVMGDEEEGGFLVKVKGSSKYLPLPIKFDGKFKFLEIETESLEKKKKKKKRERERESKNRIVLLGN